MYPVPKWGELLQVQFESSSRGELRTEDKEGKGKNKRRKGGGTNIHGEQKKGEMVLS